MLTGFKTFAFGLALAVVPSAVQYIGGFDFTKTFGLSPGAGAVIGAAMIGLRAITNTSIFASTSPAPTPDVPPRTGR